MGILDGTIEGTDVGSADGWVDGADDGSLVGSVLCVGTPEGRAVGISVSNARPDTTYRTNKIFSFSGQQFTYDDATVRTVRSRFKGEVSRYS